MWNTLTSVITRDLSEFASVVSNDAAQLLHAAASGTVGGDAVIVAGDEDFVDDDVGGASGQRPNSGSGGAANNRRASSQADQRAADEAVLELQSDIDTFRVALSESEQTEFSSWKYSSEALNADRWQRLLTESGELQEAFEVCVEGDDPCCTADEFFTRYFWRLRSLRVRMAAARNASRGGSAGLLPSAAALDGWDEDVLTSTGAATERGDRSNAHSEFGSGQVAAAASTSVTDVPWRRREEEWRQQKQDLERTVARLEMQVSQLQSENQRLARALVEMGRGAAAGVVVASEAESASAIAAATAAVEVDQRAPPSSGAIVAVNTPSKGSHQRQQQEARHGDDDDDDDWTKLT